MRASGNALAVQQAESQKQATALLVPQLEQNIAIQENALQVLTGQLPGTVNRNTTLTAFAPADQLSAGLPIAMVSRRPDVRTTEYALMIANAQVGIAQANMYPALNITAGGAWNPLKQATGLIFLVHCLAWQQEPSHNLFSEEGN